MAQPEQKEEERFFVVRLFEALNLTLLDLTSSDPAPDFIATYPGGSAGIEVTTLFEPQGCSMPRQAIESEQRAIVEAAARLWTEKHGGPISVLVHFNAQHPLKRSKRDRLATMLMEMVATRAETGLNLFKYNWINRDWVPEEFAFVRVIRSKILMEPHWAVSDAGYVSNLTQESIEAAVRAKSVPDYSSGADETWLLLAMDSFRLS